MPAIPAAAMEEVMAVMIESTGRRHYIVGNTFPLREKLRAMGAHWDADRKAWWTAKLDAAKELISTATQVVGQPHAQQVGDAAVVAGRAEYKGNMYYIAGRRCDHDGVAEVMSRDNARVLLYFRDGSSQFWADTASVRVVKSYDRPHTIAGLHEYAARAKKGGENRHRLEDGYYYGPNGDVLASGCRSCRQLGHMCSRCEHDYA
jgi:hypothetical protein